ncbi:hypothetical protein AB0A74_16380 [Saccharothrix sp. NPDC042600]|uniref:hypothetical protein n=1 Tax=Saccharothrix TaxID=2071 RepID=UPI0033F3DBC1|nr:hypothetical protein GCM10017745_46030 [Saccharothrix mutabilis subsp. capreolus]
MTTAVATLDGERHPVDEFHRLVGRVLSVNQVRATGAFLGALDKRLLLTWEFYATMLFELDTTVEERLAIRSAWVQAQAEQLPHEPPKFTAERRRRKALAGQAMIPSFEMGSRAGAAAAFVPPAGREPAGKDESDLPGLQPMLDSELQATTAEGFVRLLGDIRRRSGLSVPKWAQRAGVPRSQAYSLLRRTTLPSKPEQVQALVVAAGLPAHQVQRVMRLWNELHQRRSDPFATNDRRGKWSGPTHEGFGLVEWKTRECPEAGRPATNVFVFPHHPDLVGPDGATADLRLPAVPVSEESLTRLWLQVFVGRSPARRTSTFSRQRARRHLRNSRSSN